MLLEIGTLVHFCEFDAGVDAIPPLGHVYKPTSAYHWVPDHPGDYTPRGDEIGFIIGTHTLSSNSCRYYEVLVGGKKLWFDADCVCPL